MAAPMSTWVRQAPVRSSSAAPSTIPACSRWLKKRPAGKETTMKSIHFCALLAAAFSSQAFAQNQAKNIIFFLGDGMGPTTITAARIYQYKEEGLLNFERFERTARIKTYSAD